MVAGTKGVGESIKALKASVETGKFSEVISKFRKETLTANDIEKIDLPPVGPKVEPNEVPKVKPKEEPKDIPEGISKAIEEVKAFIEKIKTDFGSALHLKQLSEDDLIKGIAKIKDATIKNNVMKNIRSYEGAIKYNNVTTKVEADALEAAAVSNSCEVTKFAKPIDLHGLPRAGEIDVGTSKHIIEVTIGDSSKESSEFAKYFIEPINPNNLR